MEGKLKLKKPHPTPKSVTIRCYYLPPSNYLNHVRRKPRSHECSLLAVGPALAQEGAGVGGRGQVKGSFPQRQVIAPAETGAAELRDQGQPSSQLFLPPIPALNPIP